MAHLRVQSPVKTHNQPLIRIQTEPKHTTDLIRNQIKHTTSPSFPTKPNQTHNQPSFATKPNRATIGNCIQIFT